MDIPEEDEQFYLHRLVFLTLHQQLQQALEKDVEKINELDCHGNSLLTLAIMKNAPMELVGLLLEKGASTLVSSQAGWYPHQEATSIGSRELISKLLEARNVELERQAMEHGLKLVNQLQDAVPQAYFEMDFAFSSWLPFVNSYCPHDTYKVWKKNGSLRADTTLVGLEGFTWQRGNISIIFSIDDGVATTKILDRDNKKFQQIFPRKTALFETEPEIIVNRHLRSSIFMPPYLDTENVKIERAMTGLVWKAERNETVGKFATSVWNVKGLKMISKTRTEHLDEVAKIDGEAEKVQPSVEEAASEEDLQEALKAGQAQLDEISKPCPSLPPPEISEISYEEYFNTAGPRHLGRPLKEKVSVHDLSATIWMAKPEDQTEEGKACLPQIETLWPLMDMLAQGENPAVAQLQTFLKEAGLFGVEGLQGAFPVKVEFPVYYALRATVGFQAWSTTTEIPDDWFSVPDDYTEGIIYEFLKD